jgi:hypothetical protein
MKNWIMFALGFVVVFLLVSAVAVSAQQVVGGGSIGVRAGEIAQAVMVALTSLLMT